MEKGQYNNKIEFLMFQKDISKNQLAKSTGIPMTTLSRIIKGTVKKPKMGYLKKISSVLGEPIHEIFDLPEFKEEIHFGILPDEAGKIVKKILTEEESMLLYLYQCSSVSGKQKIFKLAKRESELFNKRLYQKLKEAEITDSEDEFYQMNLNLGK